MNSENLSLVLTSVASWNCKFSSGVNLKFLISQSYVHVSAACNSMSDWYRIFVATDKSHFHRIYHYISANFPVYHFLWHSIWDNCNRLISYHFWYSVSNKCIGDDTKAAASQSANCIKKQNNKIWRKTIFNMADGIITPCNVARSWHWFRQATAPCNVACGSGIITVNSPSGSTLQCDTWLWDDVSLNSPRGSTLQCDM